MDEQVVILYNTLLQFNAFNILHSSVVLLYFPLPPHHRPHHHHQFDVAFLFVLAFFLNNMLSVVKKQDMQEPVKVSSFHAFKN